MVRADKRRLFESLIRTGAPPDSDYFARLLGECTEGQLPTDGNHLRALIQEVKEKPELRAPASGPLDCHWGWSHVTA